MNKLLLSLLLLAPLLTACVNNDYCLKPQPYADARSIPPLQAAGGLQIPQSPTALTVPPPPPPSRHVPFGAKATSGDKVHVQCLDEPPPIPKPQSNIITE